MLNVIDPKQFRENVVNELDKLLKTPSTLIIQKGVLIISFSGIEKNIVRKWENQYFLRSEPTKCVMINLKNNERLLKDVSKVDQIARFCPYISSRDVS